MTAACPGCRRRYECPSYWQDHKQNQAMDCDEFLVDQESEYYRGWW